MPVYDRKNATHNAPETLNLRKSAKRFRFVEEGDRWRCVRCGACCRADFEGRWLDNIGVIQDNNPQITKCPHLIEENNKTKCSIYGNRPNACKAFPFSLRMHEDGKYKLVIHSKCKGFGKGSEINISRKILQCLNISNIEFHRKMRFDFSTFDKDKGVVLITKI